MGHTDARQGHKLLGEEMSVREKFSQCCANVPNSNCADKRVM